MSAPSRVVVIGAASHWGAEIARRLARDPEIDYVAGVDSDRPAPLAAPARHRGGHGGSLRHSLVPRAGQAGASAA